MRTSLKSLSIVLASVAILTIGAQQGTDFFQLADPNKDGFITREELRGAMQHWLGGRERVDQNQLGKALEEALPENAFLRMISPPQNRTPKAEDVEKMLAALPAAAPGKPAKPRKVLVLCTCAGYVHSCIPLAAKTVESLGSKTGAWTTAVSYEASVITAANLKQYDLVFLNNTTGFFLDDPDPGVTAARKKALLDFVRSGKGLAGVHAAGDSYHQSPDGLGLGGMLGGGVLSAADKDDDKTVDGPELNALADTWFEKVDTSHAGKVSVQEFKAAFPRLLFSSGRRSGAPAMPAAKAGPDHQAGTWPDFNRMIGGYFKYHWLDPQHIVYKIDDPASPLTAMFKDGFEINDETYTFGVNSWSRENLHVLTSIDYSKMAEADRLKEDYPRADHDYGLSWIRREGKGRVFYAAHGHSERVYASKPMLEHLLAGVQYGLGDLKANDAASVKAKK
ncbi:MAG: ThuA domain-containing protein [Bryobacteraceae bacterium]